MINDFPDENTFAQPSVGAGAIVQVSAQDQAAKKAQALQEARDKALKEATRATKWAAYRTTKVQEAQTEAEVQDALALVDDGSVVLVTPPKQKVQVAGDSAQQQAPITIDLAGKRKASDGEVLAGGGASARDKAKALLAGGVSALDDEVSAEAALSGIKRARTSRWDLVSTKPEIKTQVIADEQGRMISKKLAKLTEEEWREVALRVADTHFMNSEGEVNAKERQFYITHYHNMSRMIPKYNFVKVLEFDSHIRAEIADGLRTSWDPVPIMQEWYNRNGMWSESSAGTDKKKGPEKARKEKTCNDFNSARGCSRPTSGAGKCRFVHKCSKCGGAHSRIGCTAE